MIEKLKKYLDRFTDFYEKYLIIPTIIVCALSLIFFTVIYDPVEMITWGVLLIINLFNLYQRDKR